MGWIGSAMSIGSAMPDHPHPEETAQRSSRRAHVATASVSLAASRRLIVKIGSALLVDEASGNIRRAWLEALMEDLARCRARGQEVLIVSSGAIAVGRRHLGLAGNALKLEEKQAAAATGQIRLAHAYQEALARHGITVAQILLTPEDTEERRRHLRAIIGAGRGARGQRERHDRHRRNPLWRQRPPGRPRRADDQRRHAGPA